MANEYEEWTVTAELARLELSVGEKERLARDAEKMRELFLTMAEADVDALEPTTHAFTIGNRVRKDICAPFPGIDDLLAAAPETEDNFFLIPNVL